MYPGTGPKDKATKKGIYNAGLRLGENDIPTIDATKMNAKTDDSIKSRPAELTA